MTMMARDKDLALADVPPVTLADAFDRSGESPPPWDGPSGSGDAVTAALAATIADAFDPLAVILFGSRATEATPTRDVGLLVVLDHAARRPGVKSPRLGDGWPKR